RIAVVGGVGAAAAVEGDLAGAQRLTVGDIHVVVRIAIEQVGRRAQRTFSVFSREAVIAIAAIKRVAATDAIERIVSGIAVQCVCAFPREEAVVPVPAEETRAGAAAADNSAAGVCA